MTQRSLTFLLGLLFALIALTALRIGMPDLFGVDAVSADYVIFHQVGELSGMGRAHEAYDAEAFRGYQFERTGSSVFMTWTYPPHFNLALHPLSWLNVGLGYFLFISMSYAAMLILTYRLSAEAALWALPLTLPAMVINLMTGQNGFLTAALMAGFASLALSGRSTFAGTLLGALTYKPHLGLGLGLAALLRGGLRLVLTAIIVMCALLALATLAYGSQIWPAFLSSVSASGDILQTGDYKFARMPTVFAFFASFGASAALATALHGLWALTTLAAVAYAALRGWQAAHVWALAILAGTATSPYAYDYDLCVMAPALALAYPAIKAQLGSGLRSLLAASALVAGGYGLFTALFAGLIGDAGFGLPSLGAPALWVVLALTFTALARANRA